MKYPTRTPHTTQAKMVEPPVPVSAAPMAPARNRGVWYHDGQGNRYPALIDEVLPGNRVSIVIDDDGNIYRRTSVYLVDTGGALPAPANYAEWPAADDNVDVDKIRADKQYNLGSDSTPDSNTSEDA